MGIFFMKGIGEMVFNDLINQFVTNENCPTNGDSFGFLSPQR